MNEIIKEKIPLEERLRSVYLPIITMDCACYLAEDLLIMLRGMKLDKTKKSSRVIRGCIDGYRKDNYQAMHSDLYVYLSGVTKGFYDSMARDMTIYQLQYRQALLNKRIYLEWNLERTVTTAYIVREIVRYVLELDRDFSIRISEILGKDIHYTTEDNEYCLTMLDTLNGLLKVVGAPIDLSTQQTELALKVFKNRLNDIKI